MRWRAGKRWLSWRDRYLLDLVGDFSFAFRLVKGHQGVRGNLHGRASRSIKSRRRGG